MQNAPFLEVQEDALFQQFLHLLLQFAGLFAGYLCKVLGRIGVDDAARGVYQEFAARGHAVAAHFFERAALCPHAGYEEEVARRNAAYVFKEFALRGTYHVHHLLVSAPLLRHAEHALEETLALRVGGELEIVRALVARQGEQHRPLAGVGEKRRYAVFAHVGRNGQRVHLRAFEEGAGVHGGGVADVAALRVGNDELVGIVCLDVLHRLLKRLPAFDAEAFVESEVGLVGHAVGGGGVDDGFVEREDGFCRRCTVVNDVLRHLLQVGIESDAEERTFAGDVVDNLLFVHRM